MKLSVNHENPNIRDNKQITIDFLNSLQRTYNLEIKSIECKNTLINQNSIKIKSVTFGKNTPKTIYSISSSQYNNIKQVLLVNFWYICFNNEPLKNTESMNSSGLMNECLIC